MKKDFWNLYKKAWIIFFIGLVLVILADIIFWNYIKPYNILDISSGNFYDIILPFLLVVMGGACYVLYRAVKVLPTEIENKLCKIFKLFPIKISKSKEKLFIKFLFFWSSIFVGCVIYLIIGLSFGCIDCT